MLRETVRAQYTNQRFVLIEGMCNSEKLIDEDDRLEVRFMDEFMAIEREIGQV